MFEVSSAGIALARADRTFCRLWFGPIAQLILQTGMGMNER
jgi:hypothetical protein